MADAPSTNEDEYFLKQDAELVKELRAKRAAEREEAERQSHFMKCPKDGADLKEVKNADVSVDVCSECGGVWLDAGELDLLRKVKEHRFGSLFAEIFRSLPGK